MPSCSTTRWVSTAPYVTLTVERSSSTETTYVVAWSLVYHSDYAANTNVNKAWRVNIDGETVRQGMFNINGKTGNHTIDSGTVTLSKTTSARSVSFSVSFAFQLTWSDVYKGTLSASSSFQLPAKPSYTITYSANGGSGAPAAQTKWHGTAITLSTTKPTRNGYTFKGWATSSTATSATYAAGATYSGNAVLTLYAVWQADSYTVTYNANGGSGAPGSQTKKHGVALTLSNTKPTRTNYTFKGWGLSASSTSVSYAPGSSYTNNSSITLYAVWEYTYEKPKLTSFSVWRVDSDGNKTDSGYYAIVKFGYEFTVQPYGITIEWKSTSESDWSTDRRVVLDMRNYTKDQWVGTVEEWIGIDGVSLDPELSYSIRVNLIDSVTDMEISATRHLPGLNIPIDVHHTGKGVAIGKPAEVPNLFDVEFLSRFRRDVMVGEKTGYLDGNQGVYIDSEGFIHLQRDSSQGYHPYIGFFLDNATDADGQIRLNSNDRIMEFLNAAGYLFGNDLIFKNNNTSLYGYTSGGVKKECFTPQNASGNTIIGYGNYTSKSGNTNIYGNDVVIASAAAGNASCRPYYRSGDSISIGMIYTAGFVTNSSNNVQFFIPLSRPIIGSPTVSIAFHDSDTGLIIRQAGKYTHGSAASAAVIPTSCTASARPGGVVVVATFTTITNAINNEACGIAFDGYVEFD